MRHLGQYPVTTAVRVSDLRLTFRAFPKVEGVPRRELSGGKAYEVQQHKIQIMKPEILILITERRHASEAEMLSQRKRWHVKGGKESD
jgi:hypothetical protein